VTDHETSEDLQEEVVDQSAAERDPADDSDEADDPSAMVDTYPAVFDEKIAEAERALVEHRQDDGEAADHR
jgi:hypothetical protein